MTRSELRSKVIILEQENGYLKNLVRQLYFDKYLGLKVKAIKGGEMVSFKVTCVEIKADMIYLKGGDERQIDNMFGFYKEYEHSFNLKDCVING